MRLDYCFLSSLIDLGEFVFLFSTKRMKFIFIFNTISFIDIFEEFFYFCRTKSI